VNTLIAPDQTWALWAVLLSCAAFGLWAERTRLGARLSGAVVTLLAAFTLSNLNVIPAVGPVYDTVWSYLVPLAIPLLLFHANLRRIVRESGATLIAFVIGAGGTVLGTWMAFHLVPLGEHGWQLAAIFSATYIGGSMNYMGTAEAVGLRSGDLLSAGIAADNLMMTLYFLILFTLPSIVRLRRQFHELLPDRWASSTTEVVLTETRKGARFHLPSLAGALALSAGICAVSYWLERRFALAGIAILILTGITVLLATAQPHRLARLEGSGELGMLLMQVFFAAIGASANIATVLKVGPILFVFAGIILTVHLTVILLGGWMLRLSLPEIVIASNANMGGPTTAAAMAAAKRWEALVIPAILCGTLGYASATFIGVALGNWLR
jgi:uncharacterized membrane protein